MNERSPVNVDNKIDDIISDMSTKTTIWIGVFIGGTIGGYIPYLWGAGFLSFSSLLLSALGSLAGLYLGFKISHY